MSFYSLFDLSIYKLMNFDQARPTMQCISLVLWHIPSLLIESTDSMISHPVDNVTTIAIHVLLMHLMKKIVLLKRHRFTVWKE